MSSRKLSEISELISMRLKQDKSSKLLIEMEVALSTMMSLSEGSEDL